MAEKKVSVTTIGLAMLIFGTLSLLESTGVFSPFRNWWLPVILIVVGLLVVLNRKGTVRILGWLCLGYGAVLLLMAMGLFHLTFLWQISPIAWIFFGLFLLL
jgi:hypothetical protein